MSQALIVIPIRLASVRLPQKPLADIHGKPMALHVWERAVAAGIAPVIVACDSPEVKDLIEKAGGQAVMTDPELPSGSDRVYAALEAFDPQGMYDVVVNLQGDLPNVDPHTIQAVLNPLKDSHIDVATVAAEITDVSELSNPNVVKIALSLDETTHTGRALYFSRQCVPYGDGPHYHHIGIYAYRRPALKKFVDLPPSPLEKRERLEQLRLVEKGITFGVAFVKEIPVSVDTAEDLERARQALAPAA